MRQTLQAGILATIAAAASVNAATASAQDKPNGSSSKQPQQSPSKGGQETDPGILSGPKVEPDATRQPNRPERPNAGGDRQREIEIPFQQWIGALRGLGLSENQQVTVRTASGEFQTAVEDFQREHGEEIRDLMQQARESRQNGTEPPKGLRENLRKIDEARPKPDQYKEQIWAALNEQQQNEMKDKLDAMRKEMMRNRGDRREDRRGINPPTENPPANDAMMPPSPGDRPGADRRPPGRPGDGTGLDEMARRRVEFLRSHQSPRRPGGGPTDDQRHFEFDDPDQPMPNDDQRPTPPAPRES